MIERVARALCAADGHDPNTTHDIHVPDDPVAGFAWAGYRREARAAIEAMREPTEWMMSGNGFGDTIQWMESGPRDVWERMIDAALKS